VPFSDSRIRTGKFTLAVGAAPPEDFAVPLTAITITPEYDESGDAVIFVSGERIAPDETSSDTIQLSFIQDFEDAAGLVRYLWANDGELAAFAFETGTVAEGGVRWTGTVKLRRPPTGGQAGVRLDGEVELPVVGAIVGPLAVT
jgi:hypothetical protein